MGVLQLFYADAPHPEGFLRRTLDGALEVHSPQRRFGKVERKLIRALRRLGFWSAPPLIRYGEGGGSFHYAGTLPYCAKTPIKMESQLIVSESSIVPITFTSWMLQHFHCSPQKIYRLL